MRVLITSLSTYSAPYNDGKLERLADHVGSLTVVAGDGATLWGKQNQTRSRPGYDVVVLPLRRARSNATARLVGLEALAAEVKPTVIHVECEPWQGVAVQSLKLAKHLGIPIGVQFAECGPLLRGPGGAMRKARGAWVLRRCDYAVGWAAGSTRVAERLAPGIRTATFPATGISTDRESTNSVERWFGTDSAHLPKIVFVGRFMQEKGINDFLRICDALSNRMPLRVAIAGGEGSEDSVRAWAAQRPWARLHGILPRTSVISLLSAADVLVCPSRTTRTAEEQFGKAAAESMSVGTPVFAYACGALPEVIGDGGVVVPEGAQDRLTDALEAFASAPAPEVAALRQAALTQAARFTDDALARRLIELWSTLDRSVP